MQDIENGGRNLLIEMGDILVLAYRGSLQKVFRGAMQNIFLSCTTFDRSHSTAHDVCF